MAFELMWPKDCAICGSRMEEGDLVKYEDGEIVDNQCASEPDPE